MKHPGYFVYAGDRPFDRLEIPEPDPRETADYEWAMTDLVVRREYGGLIVAVHEKKVWGAGRTPELALEAARTRPGCPSPELLVLACVSSCSENEAAGNQRP